ncbi:MAG: beta-propeller fold lactonase family protein [Saprospiraceae bacterium]|nr:beta-propeller fold lactonase family protein [Saprospiraceae bacterium]
MNRRTFYPSTLICLFISFGYSQSTSWQDITLPNINGIVQEVEISPAGTIYAIGQFSSAGSTPINKIAKLVSGAWVEVGGGPPITDNNLIDIEIDAAGNVYLASGTFDLGCFCYNSKIHKWNGSSWSEIGSALDLINQIEVTPGGSIYAMGLFTSISGTAANKLAYYNGSTWTAILGGVGQLGRMKLDPGNNLYVANVSSVNSLPANLAKWNGTSWQILNTESFSNQITDMEIGAGSDVYVGGYFTTIGSVSHNRVAKFDGTAWSPLATGIDGPVKSLFYHNNTLYVGGQFTSAGTLNTDNFAFWNGSTWNSFGGGVVSTNNPGYDEVTTVVYNSQGEVIAGGEIFTAGYSFIAKWSTQISCTVLSTPLNNATNVPVTAALSWGPVANISGYKLLVGTTPSGGEILDSFDVGNVTTFNPPGNFPYNDIIYVKILPYNGNGAAAGCLEESFTTQANPCPTNVFLLSQSTVNSFQSTYPGCIDIPGDLIIVSSAITNLNGLSQISSVGGAFEIYETHLLNLVGLENLKTIGENAYIHYNAPYLNSLNGLNGLDSIYGNLEIFANHLSFTNIQALSNLDFIGGDLRIQYNPQLSNCAVSEICNYISVPNGAIFIGSNKAGCNNTSEILTSCNPNFPLCTNLTSPLNNQTNVSVNSNISWSQAGGGPTGYKISIGITSNGTEIINNLDVGNTTSYNPPSNLPYGTTIYVKIIPYNSNGETYWCPGESFMTEPLPLPNCTTLTSPLNGAVNIQTTASLSWTPASGNPTGYKLLVETAPGLGDIMNNVDVGNVTTYNPPGDFPYGSTIRVKVTPYNIFGNALNCITESFIITNFPCTQLVSPLNGASNIHRTTALNWNTVPGNPTGYKLTIGTTPSNANILNNVDVGNITSYDLPGEYPQDSSIYVKIIPFNANGQPSACPIDSFNTMPLITANGPWSGVDVGLSEGANDIQLDTAGNLIVAGGFSHAGGLFVNHIAKWNGNSWLNLGEGINAPIGNIKIDSLNNIFAVWQSTGLYYISKYNGSTWAIIGSTPGDIHDMILNSANELIVAGNFTSVSGVSAINIAKWDGSTWMPLGSGINNNVWALTSFNNIIYAGGDFTQAGGNPAQYVAKWDGASWSALGSGTGYTGLNDMDCDPYGNLYTTSYTYGTFQHHVQKWNGTVWTEFGYQYNQVGIEIEAVDSNEVYVCGWMTYLGGVNTGPIAKWNGTVWQPIGYPGPISNGGSYFVTNMQFDLNGKLYVIGDFNLAVGVPANGIAKFDPSSQLAGCTYLSTPANNSVNIFVNSNLTWNLASNASGYKIHIGTTSGGSDVLNNYDAGNVTTYNPPNDFNHNTLYYVRIIPYNSNGESLGCLETTFKTIISGGNGFAYVPNAFTNNVSVVSMSNYTTVATIPVGSYPVSSGILPDGSKIFVSNRNSNTVSVIDGATNTVSQTITVGTNPMTLAVNGSGTRVYLANFGSNSVSVIDASNATVLSTISVGTGPIGLEISPNDSMLYVSNSGSNNISVINLISNSVVATVNVGSEPRGISAKPDGSRVYVANYLSNTVSVLNTSTNTIISTLNVGVKPNDIAIHPDGSRMYVTNQTSNNVWVINLNNNTLIAIIPVISFPYGASISCNGNIVCICNSNSITNQDKISIINTFTNSVIANVNVGYIPIGFGKIISSGIPPNVTLSAANSPLSGLYQAANTIYINGNVSILPGSNVQLIAPFIKVMNSLNLGLLSNITIKRSGCGF